MAKLYGEKELRPFHHTQYKPLLIKRRPMLIFGNSELFSK